MSIEPTRPVERRTSLHKPERQPIRKRVIAAGAIAVSAVSMTPYAAHSISSEKGSDNPYSATSVLTQVSAYGDTAVKAITGGDYCPDPPSPEDTNIFFADEPLWPEEMSIHDVLSQTDLTTVEDDKSYIDFQKGINEAESQTEVIEALNTYTEKEYGITTTLKGFDGEHVDQLIDKNTLANKSNRLASNMFYIPKELVEASGVTNIEIRPLFQETYDEDSNWGASGRFNYDTNGSTMLVDINMLDDKEVIYHEMFGHGLHYTSCNGFSSTPNGMTIFRDNAISSANSDDFSYSRINKSIAPITDPTEADYFINEYQKFDVREDVAMLTELILAGKIDINDPDLPEPIRQKASVIIDRIEEQAPGSVAWMRHLNRHNNS